MIAAAAQQPSFNDTYVAELQRLQQAQDWTHLEQVARQALSAMETQFGADSSSVAAAAGWLANALVAQRRYAEAEPVARRSLTVNEKALGPDAGNTGISLDTLAVILKDEGHVADAEPLARRALAISEATNGPEAPGTAHCLDGLADALQRQGQYPEAETLRRRSLAILEKKFGSESAMAAQGLDNLGGLFLTQSRLDEAEPLFRHSVAIREKLLGPDHPDTALNLNNLATLLTVQGRYAEAEVLERRVLAIFEKSSGQGDFNTSLALANLASAVSFQGRFSEAEQLQRRALAIVDTPARQYAPDTAHKLNNLADFLNSEGRYGDAESTLQRALAIFEKTLGPDDTKTLTVRSNLANSQALQGKFAAATANLRIDCATRSSQGGASEQSGAAARAAKLYAGKCWTRLSRSLWDWSAHGGGTAASDRPEALKLEAFAASQRAVQSAAGDAMARSAALTVAEAAAVGAEARAYEAALGERDTLALNYAKAAGESGAANLEKSEALAKARADSLVTIEKLAAQIKAKAPLYWDYRSPTPISAAALQAKTGADAVLLRPDEALIVMVVAEGKDKGLTFALSKDQLVWAQLGLSGDEIKARVNKLRSQIDPDAYGLGDIGVNPGPFNRQAAYELYQALLGDAAVQAVIKNKPVLLFVPSGPLISLPPALLVTAPPQGAGDTDPEALRATPWLLRSYAVGLLPAVSSLRTLRQSGPADRGHASDPLLAFADPDFVRRTTTAAKPAAKKIARGFSSYFRDGLPLAEALDELPQLPGTRIEGEALMKALHGRPGSLLVGRNASKAELMMRNRDGRLGMVRVLEFATHGLVAGDASDLAEPALALAAGAKPADELLLASEAATLQLNADWVLLSACNTASPDAPAAEGLSGLSRAFFYAGAKSLLVSHWRVRDDVAPLLIPAMLLAGREHPDLTRAQALREASLAILDNRALNAADPAAWAPFTLIGEAGP